MSYGDGSRGRSYGGDGRGRSGGSRDYDRGSLKPKPEPLRLVTPNSVLSKPK